MPSLRSPRVYAWGEVTKFILRTAGKTDLKKLTVSNWETVFDTFKKVSSEENGALKCVSLIEAKL